MSAVVPTGAEIACDLAEAAAQMVALRHHREHPDSTIEELDAVVQRWWSGRPSEATVDADGWLRLRHSLR